MTSKKYEILFLVLLLYFITGVFPFAYFESDALGIVTGSRKIIELGQLRENFYTYSYSVQTGTYFWVVLLNILTELDLMICSSLITAGFGVLFFLFSTRFVSKVTNTSFAKCGLVLLLFQEIFSSWYYMNAATGAAFFMILGFNLIYDKPDFVKSLMCGVALAVAAYTKLDVMVSFPVVCFMFINASYKQRVLYVLLIGIVVILLLCVLFKVSHVDKLQDVIAGHGGSLSFSDNIKTVESVSYSQFVRTLVGYFSLLVAVLIVVGLVQLFRMKEWKIFVISLVPVVFFMLVINVRFVAGKHLLYLIPFFAVPSVYASNYIFNLNGKCNQIWRVVVVVVFVMQYIVGFQFYFKSFPYIREEYSVNKPYPTYFDILSFEFNTESIDSLRVVLGGGTKLATSDEVMLSSGIIYAPLMWKDLKIKSGYIYESFLRYLTGHKIDTLYITTGQGGVYPIKNLLYLSGFEILNSESERYTWRDEQVDFWRKGAAIVLVKHSVYPKNDQGLYAAKMDSVKYSHFTHIAFWDWEKWRICNYDKHIYKINDAGYVFNR
ncbi:hypothetical protein ACFPMF_24855 [Larkinella bovis]|uniref:Glycosyltransferase RgtA/B/C/D-like domain-containing protein n=1 Tax=Larkinella bovis TaxID=683041 RepID=A0ABW0IJ85_9BACT